MPSLSERVDKYLRERPGAVLCDDCVAAGVKTRHSLTRMLDVYSSDYFRRAIARCDSCGRTAMGIARYPLRH